MVVSEIQLDYLKEVFNIGVGRGAKILNTMLNSHITLSVPKIRILDEQDNIDELLDLHSYKSIATVDLPFKGSLNGVSKLLFPADSALKLVQEIAGDQVGSSETGFDAISEGVLKEIGNIVLNSVIGVLCNYLKIQLQYTVPAFSESPVDALVKDTLSKSEDIGLLAKIHFSVETMDIHGDIMTIFKMGSFVQLLKLIDEQLNA